MRMNSDELGGLLRPLADKPRPRQPTSRERAAANRLRVLQAVAEHGHLRCADLACCWPGARYGEQMAQRTVRALVASGELLARRNCHGGLSYVPTRCLSPPEQARHAPQDPPPDTEAFAIGDFQVGRTTLDEVQSRLGAAHAQMRDDGLVRTLCYFSPATRGFVSLHVDASVLGGLQRLTGFNMGVAREHPKNCSAAQVDLNSMAIGLGVKLGESEREFRAHLPVRFVRRGSRLIAEVEYKREMTDEELTSMRQQWPEMKKPSFFDVDELIQGRFRNGVLEYYEVRRSESY